jgi:hypothetical protein
VLGHRDVPFPLYSEHELPAFHETIQADSVKNMNAHEAKTHLSKMLSDVAKGDGQITAIFEDTSARGTLPTHLILWWMAAPDRLSLATTEL